MLIPLVWRRNHLKKVVYPLPFPYIIMLALGIRIGFIPRFEGKGKGFFIIRTKSG